MEIVTIYRAFNLADAELVRSRLEAAGFHPFVADEMAAGNLPLISAGGGIRVQVPDTEAAEARAFLDSSTESSAAPESPA
jgi:hypothetical protein